MEACCTKAVPGYRTPRRRPPQSFSFEQCRQTFATKDESNRLETKQREEFYCKLWLVNIVGQRTVLMNGD